MRGALACLLLLAACGSARRIDVGRGGHLELDGAKIGAVALDAALHRGDRVVVGADPEVTWADMRPVLRACFDNSVSSIETEAGTLHLHNRLSREYLVFSVHVVPGPYYRVRPRREVVWNPADLTARMAARLRQAELYAHPFAGEISAEPEVALRHVWAVARAMADAGTVRRGPGARGRDGEVVLSLLVP